MLARTVAWSLLAFGCGPKAGVTTAPAAAPAPEATADDASATEEPARPEPRATPVLYRAVHGDADPTVVFLHGGPGYNSALFEATTAEVLAADYRVVVYDRRGTARSPDPSQKLGAYTFARAVADLDTVLGDAEAPILLGHSFGGAVALAYLDEHPQFDGQVVLINAPVSYPRSLKTIIANCREVYEAKGDDASLESLDNVAKMVPSTAPYANFVFMHGMSCGLYRPSAPTSEAKSILTAAAEHPAAEFFSISTPAPVMGFIANEQYTRLDLTASVQRHATKVWAIYGDEDRIISPDDRATLQQLLGGRYREIEGAAHNVFVDQQRSFVKAVDEVVAARTSECQELSGSADSRRIEELPRPIVRPKPKMCDAVRKGLTAGSVELDVRVGCDGRVDNVTVASGIGHGCDELAVEMMRGARFKPAKNNRGKPARVTIRWSYTFVHSD